jgi:hypothetical protein
MLQKKDVSFPPIMTMMIPRNMWVLAETTNLNGEPTVFRDHMSGLRIKSCLPVISLVISRVTG